MLENMKIGRRLMLAFGFVLALLVLAMSLGLAWLASDGAHWCRVLGWCDRRSLM